MQKICTGSRRYCNIEIGNEIVQSRVLVVDDEPKIIEVLKLAAFAVRSFFWQRRFDLLGRQMVKQQ